MDEKITSTIAILVFMIAVLVFNTVFSVRENYLEGFVGGSGFDPSGTAIKADPSLNMFLSSHSPAPVQSGGGSTGTTGTMTKSDLISNASAAAASGAVPEAAPDSSTEGFAVFDQSNNPAKLGEIAAFSNIAMGGGLPTKTTTMADSLEGFETLFDPQYANASHWSSSSMNFFKGVPFKPACCEKSDYSTSTGCACLNGSKINEMHHNGYNN